MTRPLTRAGGPGFDAEGGPGFDADYHTYTGTTTVSGGLVVVSNATALGTTAGNTSVSSGAAVQVGETINVAEPITLNGTGIGNAGALRKTGENTTTWSGAITLGPASRINADPGTLAITGAVGGGANGLTVGGGGNTTISGPITMSGTLTHDSAMTLTIGVANPTTFAGAIVANSGAC